MKKDDIPEGYIRRATSTIPFGYETSDIQGWLQPIQEQLDSLRNQCLTNMPENPFTSN